MKINKLCALVALVAAAAAHAETATVEAVQYPAWLDRGGASVPLVPGTRLQPRDQLRTGENGRVRMKMGEGSAVKLGERAQLVIEVAEDKNVFRAGLAVLAGAFRFTTDALANRKRDVSIKAKSVTVGIRGTDLWGKSSGDRDLVCLLEGRISVGAEGHPQVTLDKPLDFYQKPRDAAPSVASVDPKQLETWAAETEMSPDGAAATSQGRWRVVAAVKSTRNAALAIRARLRAAGYPAEISQKDKYFAVQVTRLAGEKEARALMSAIRGIEGVDLPTVHEGP
ncbi:MAG TPA: FecR domain-containing protein [Usitatibacter sp.]|nr:FecR domain-containing protein [Usitatibacter sp.]